MKKIKGRVLMEKMLGRKDSALYHFSEEAKQDLKERETIKKFNLKNFLPNSVQSAHLQSQAGLERASRSQLSFDRDENNQPQSRNLLSACQAPSLDLMSQKSLQNMVYNYDPDGSVGKQVQRTLLSSSDLGIAQRKPLKLLLDDLANLERSVTAQSTEPPVSAGRESRLAPVNKTTMDTYQTRVDTSEHGKLSGSQQRERMTQLT
jgi:hypothetical protein